MPSHASRWETSADGDVQFTRYLELDELLAWHDLHVEADLGLVRLLAASSFSGGSGACSGWPITRQHSRPL
jgi:hypothetical protein